jgi:hypothetical protein
MSQIEENTQGLNEILKAINDLPESGGGTSGEQVQSDWEQTNEAMPSFIKNKPFEDNIEITETFIMTDDADLVTIHAGTGFTAYKLFDTILTKEQILDSLSVTISPGGVGSAVCSFSDATFQNLTEDSFIAFGENGVTIAIVPRPDKLQYYTSNITVPTELNLTETGFYILVETFDTIPSGTIVEINYKGTKKIDSKFIPKKRPNFEQEDKTKEDYIENRPIYVLNSHKHIVDWFRDDSVYQLYKIGDFVPQKGLINEVTGMVVGDGTVLKGSMSLKVSDEKIIMSRSNGDFVGALSLDLGEIPIYFVYNEYYDEENDTYYQPGVYVTLLVAILCSAVRQAREEGNPEAYLHCEFNCKTYTKLENKYLHNSLETLVIPCDINELENTIDVEPEMGIKLYDSVVSGRMSDLSLKFFVSDLGTEVTVPLRHIGLGIFEASVFLDESFFFNYVYAADTENMCLSFIKKYSPIPQESTEASTYGLRRVSLEDKVKDSLAQRGFSKDFINSKADKDKITNILNALFKKEEE